MLRARGKVRGDWVLRAGIIDNNQLRALYQHSPRGAYHWRWGTMGCWWERNHSQGKYLSDLNSSVIIGTRPHPCRVYTMTNGYDMTELHGIQPMWSFILWTSKDLRAEPQPNLRCSPEAKVVCISATATPDHRWFSICSYSYSGSSFRSRGDTHTRSKMKNLNPIALPW